MHTCAQVEGELDEHKTQKVLTPARHAAVHVWVLGKVRQYQKPPTTSWCWQGQGSPAPHAAEVTFAMAQQERSLSCINITH